MGQNIIVYYLFASLIILTNFIILFTNILFKGKEKKRNKNVKINIFKSILLGIE